MYRTTIIALLYCWTVLVGAGASQVMPLQSYACTGCSETLPSNLDECCLITETHGSIPPCCYEADPSFPTQDLMAVLKVTPPSFLITVLVQVENLSISGPGFSESNLARSPPEGETLSIGTALNSKQAWRL